MTVGEWLQIGGGILGTGVILGGLKALKEDLKELKADVKEVKAQGNRHETAIAVLAATAPRQSMERTIPGMPALRIHHTGTDDGE